MRREFKTEWQFARIDLSKDQRNAFELYVDNPSNDPMDLLPIVLEQGYKISITYNQKDDNWIASLTGTPLSQHNQRTTLTAFHKSMHKALMLVLFKHIEIANSGAWAIQPPRQDWG